MAHDPKQTNPKHNAAKKWVWAVNNLADFGRWDFLVCRDLEELEACLVRMLKPEFGDVKAGPQVFELRV